MSDLLARMHNLTADLADLHREMYDLTKNAYPRPYIEPAPTEDLSAVPVGHPRPRHPRRRRPHLGHQGHRDA
jgi:hypothetical protein